MTIKSVLRGFSSDCRRKSVPVACLRLARVTSLISARDRDVLLRNKALGLHVDAIDRDDPFFCVSHRHYLAQGLTGSQRIDMARHHYEHEVRSFGSGYFDAAYSDSLKGKGLLLWHRHAKCTDFELRLSSGSDVLYEGGMSVTLWVDGARVAVVSYSNVDREIVFDDDASGETTTLFVTRKQLTSDHSYQRAFNAAFNRCSAAHFCLAALTGIAQAQGYSSIAGIRPQVHPSFTYERRLQFEASYGRFWESAGGRVKGRFAYEVPVPMQLSSLATMTSKARRRAIRRRAHLDDVVRSTSAVIREHLRSSSDSTADDLEDDTRTELRPTG